MDKSTVIHSASWALHHGRDLYFTVLGGALTYGGLKWVGGMPAKQAFKPAWQVFSFGRRLAWNTGRAIALTRLGTSASSYTVGGLAVRMAGGALGGLALGAAVGTAISQSVWGDSGREKALDLYLPGGASLGQEILNIPSNAKAIMDHYYEESFG